MYELIRSIIDHTWQTSGATGDQQYIYYICGSLIIIFSCVFIDLIYRIIRGICRKGEF